MITLVNVPAKQECTDIEATAEGRMVALVAELNKMNKEKNHGKKKNDHWPIQ